MAAGCTQDRDKRLHLKLKLDDGAGRVMSYQIDCLARKMNLYFYKSRQAFESVIQERSEPGSRVQ